MQIRRKKRTCMSLLIFLFSCMFLWFLPVSAEAAVPTSVKIPVSCEGGNPLEEFTCVLEMESHELQTPDNLIIRMKSGEEGAFTIHYVYPGVYHYRIRQEEGANKKTSYDSTVYEVDVYVTEDEKGQLEAEPVVFTQGSSEKKAMVAFHNTGSGTPSRTIRTSGGYKSSGNVMTGDSAEPLFYISLLTASAVTLLAAVKQLHRKKGGKQI
ncbi:MAG: hypothetical protein MJ116_01590 [Lachnospiraceae bacterium]|nr:hypothetical protein [Lachnospiraceae bacterium]